MIKDQDKPSDRDQLQENFKKQASRKQNLDTGLYQKREEQINERRQALKSVDANKKVKFSNISQKDTTLESLSEEIEKMKIKEQDFND